MFCLFLFIRSLACSVVCLFVWFACVCVPMFAGSALWCVHLRMCVCGGVCQCAWCASAVCLCVCVRLFDMLAARTRAVVCVLLLLLFVVCRLLFVVCLFVVCCLLFVVYCLLFIVLLFMGCCVSCVLLLFHVALLYESPRRKPG